MADTTGEADLRKQNWDKTIRGFALQTYKMKQVVSVVNSSAWTESYYAEGSSELTGGTGSAVKGIPRLANFPYGEPNWTLYSSRQEKYGMEGVVSWEDATTNNVDVISRTLLRIARAVTKAVDDQIVTALIAGAGNTVACAVGSEWDAAVIGNRDPIQNILNAKKEIAIDNYDIDANGYLIVSPKGFADLLGNANVRNSGQFFTDTPTRDGKVGRIVGLTIIVTNSMTADYAMVVVGQECAVWRQAKLLTTHTIEDPGVKYTIRAYEVGVLQVVNPNAVCTITNTEA